MTDEQITNEFQTILGEIKGGWAEIKPLPATFKTLQDQTGQLQQHVTELRRLLASRAAAHPRARTPGVVSDECARHLAAQFIVQCEKSARMEALCSLPAQRDALANFARNTLNLSSRAALTVADIPLPVEFSGEIRELISEFGV